MIASYDNILEQNIEDWIYTKKKNSVLLHGTVKTLNEIVNITGTDRKSIHVLNDILIQNTYFTIHIYT